MKKKIIINEAQLQSVKNYLQELKDLEELKVFAPWKTLETAIFYNDQTLFKKIFDEYKRADEFLLNIALNFQRKKFTTDTLIEIEIPTENRFKVVYKNILTNEEYYSELFGKHPETKIEIPKFWIIVLQHIKKNYSDHPYNYLILTEPFLVEE